MAAASSLSLCARMTLNLHSLNNEGTEGNQQQTRMVHIIDQKGKRTVVNAISGDMFKHILVEHLVPLLAGAGEPLSEPASRLDPDRITADEAFLNFAKNHEGLNSELLTKVLEMCSLTDIAGALFVDAALPRKSCVEFGWVVGLPTDGAGEALTTTEQYFHVKYSPERGKAAGEETTVGKQPIFHRPASSGVYALVCNLDLYRIGLNDITRRYVIGKEGRQARARCLLHAMAATLLKPAGAQRNTQNPHIVDCQGAIAISATSLPAPSISPLHDNYREQIQEAADVLNGIREGGVTVRAFDSLADGVRALADAAVNPELPGE